MYLTETIYTKYQNNRDIFQISILKNRMMFKRYFNIDFNYSHPCEDIYCDVIGFML